MDKEVIVEEEDIEEGEIIEGSEGEEATPVADADLTIETDTNQTDENTDSEDESAE